MRTPHNEQLGATNPAGAGHAPVEPPVGGAVRAPRPRKQADVTAQERRCIITGERGERGDLLRLAIGPDGMVLPDIMARAPGRGAWIGVDAATLSGVIAKGKFQGALSRAVKGAPVRFAPTLPEQVSAAFERHVLAQLGLAAKAGVLLSGADKIDQAARAGMVAFLGHAADAADDGRRKRDQSWRVGEDREGSDLAGVMLPIDRTTLSVALGRDNIVHIAICDRAWADRVKSLLDRWHRYARSASGASGCAEAVKE